MPFHLREGERGQALPLIFGMRRVGLAAHSNFPQVGHGYITFAGTMATDHQTPVAKALTGWNHDPVTS